MLYGDNDLKLPSSGLWLLMSAEKGFIHYIELYVHIQKRYMMVLVHDGNAGETHSHIEYHEETVCISQITTPIQCI